MALRIRTMKSEDIDKVYAMELIAHGRCYCTREKNIATFHSSHITKSAFAELSDFAKQMLIPFFANKF